jgi:hypothetical protein
VSRNEANLPRQGPQKTGELATRRKSFGLRRRPTPDCIGYEGLRSAINPKQDQTKRKLNYNSPTHLKAASAQRHRALQAKTKGNTHHVFRRRGFEPRALTIRQANTDPVSRDPRLAQCAIAGRRNRPVQRSPRCRPLLFLHTYVPVHV